VRSVDPLQPAVDIRTMEDVMSRSITQRRLLTSLMAGFAALAVVLSIIGIYGVLSYLVSNRSREIGIPMCLGAQYGEILSLVTRQLIPSATAGLLGGLITSLATTHVLSRWLFSVRPNDPMTLTVAAMITVAVAILGGIVPAVRALRVDPISAVRME
jgi:ABC-type antimicrobial peptide transport system permease subunit